MKKCSHIRARGPKTEAIAVRRGPCVTVTWVKRGVERTRRVYEPYYLDVTPALADMLALALEGGDAP